MNGVRLSRQFGVEVTGRAGTGGRGRLILEERTLTGTESRSTDKCGTIESISAENVLSLVRYPSLA